MLSQLATAVSLLLLATCIDAVPYDFNFLDNYRRPAPSPEDGPPASRHASRNKGLLPAQVCAIVGAYVFTVLIWGVLLLTVGRKMRRKAENPPKHLELELVTARYSSRTPVSPQSARSATSWFKRGFKNKNGIDSAVNSPVVQSPVTFDQKVIESDRDRAQADMERLYAAVMEHDRKKSYSQVSTDETEPKDRRLPRIDTTREAGNYSNPASPMRAIYPPGYNNGPATAPLQRPESRRRDHQHPPASPRSILSKKSIQSTASSTTSKPRFNLKNLRISGPMKYPDNAAEDDEARTPLSPQFYNSNAPPSPPTQQNSPTTPGDLEEAYAYEQLDEVQPLPRPAPQRLNSYPNNSNNVNDHANESRTPTSATGPAHPRSATSSQNSLPLRGYEQPLKSPDLRTTVLDRRLDKLSLTTPKTGVPYTPYSPYMPFTPLTPVTPHLVTKKDRRRERKEGSGRERSRRGEMVQSPKEIFGDAW
jgi:hypothetical protein